MATDYSELLASVSDMKPDEAADILRTSRQMRVPVQDVAANPEYYKNGVVDPGNWDALVANSPKTASFLENPLNMAIHREPERIRHLTTLETLAGIVNPLASPAAMEGWKDLYRNTVDFFRGTIESGRYNALKTRSDIDQFNPPEPEQMPLGVVPNDQYGQAYDKLFDPSQGVESKELRDILRKDWLQPIQIKAAPETGKVGEYLVDLQRQAPQFAAQVALSLATQGLGTAGSFLASTAFMGTQIAGGSYGQLTAEGIDPDRAFRAGIANAALQAPLEALSIEGIAKGHLAKWAKTQLPKAGAKAVATETVLLSGLSEFLTEWVQKYPEAATEIWAKGEGLSPREQFGQFMDNFWTITKEGLYEGLIAAPFGALGGGARVYHDKIVERRLEAQNARIEAIVAELQKQDLLGKTPETLQDFVAHVTDGEVVYVEPAALNQLFQTVDIEEVAPKLGITPEQIAEAEKTGEMVEVPLANYVVAAAQMPEIQAALKDNIAHESTEGLTKARVDERNLRDTTNAKKIDQQMREEVKAEIDNLVAEMTAAAEGTNIPAAAAAKVARIMEARAWAEWQNGRAESPAQWLRDNKIRFENAANAQPAAAVVASTPVSLQPLEQQLADRAVAAIQGAEYAVDGSLNAMLAGSNDPRLYSIHNIPEWKKGIADYMQKQGKTPLEIANHLNAVDKQLAMFSALGKNTVELIFPHTADTRTADSKNPIRKNTDPIYKISFDLSALCVKRLSAQATRVYIEEKLGRPMSAPELTAMVAMFKIAGKPAPCLYCYVEAPRAKANEFLQTAYDLAFNNEEPPSGWKAATRELLAAAREEVKKLGATAGEFRVINDPAYAVTEAGLTELASKPDLYKFLSAMYNSAKANQPKLYAEYAGQILGLKQDTLDELSNYAGFRYFSSSDFQYEHVVDLMQSFMDMALRQVTSHAYTKVWEYAKIFGQTRQKIQLSVFAKTDAHGNIVQDTWQGMDWEKAKELRSQSKDTGTILVATSDEIIQWGLQQDWIDYIIPFHLSGVPKEYADDMGWVNYTGTQSETSLDAGVDAAKIRMHEMGTAKGITDENGTRAYLKLALERRLLPVFPQFLFKDYDPNKVIMNKRGTEALAHQDEARLDAAKNRWREMVEKGKIDWDQINPTYFKLKKDYARTDTPFQPVQAKFDMPTVKQVLAKLLADDGVPRAVVETEIADKLIPLIDEYQKSGGDIGLDKLREARMLDDAAGVAVQLKENHAVYNTDEEALRYATEALAQTVRVEESAGVQSQQGTLDGGQPQDGSPDQKREVPTGRRVASTVGYGITPELISKGAVSLLGKTVRSSRELAVKAQVLRHPGYETLHIIYTRQGQVVHHEALSCRLPGMVTFDYNDGQHPVLHIDEILTTFGADGWYFLHNHPSGRPNPSPEDVQLTTFYGDIKTSTGSTNNPVNRGFKGHVVVNSTQFAVIDRAGNVTMEDLPTKILAKQDYFKPSKPHPALKTRTTDPGVIAGMAKALQLDPDVSVVFVTDTQLVTRAVVEVQNSLFDKDSKTVERYLRMLTRAHNGTNLFLSTTNRDLYDNLARYVERGFFVDVVHTDSESGLRASGVQPGAYANENWMGLPTGQKAPVARVLEKNMAELYQSPLGFYSATASAIKAMDFKAMPAQDLANRITKTPGIKQEELDDLGLIDWLKGQDGKVTKEQVLAFVEQGGVEIEEVVKGAGGEARLAYDQDPEDGSWRVFTVDNDEIIEAFENQAEAREFTNRENSKRGNTKFSQYQLPGGENYREVLLTLPEQTDQKMNQISQELFGKNYSGLTDAKDRVVVKHEYAKRYGELATRNGAEGFRSSHWSELNVLAHFRLDDRTDANGNKVLFIEEIQSDWHQHGKKEGYGNTEKYGVFVNENLIGEFASKSEAKSALAAAGGNGEILDWSKKGVPNAPFKSTPAWSMLAFKRILRMAVEQGYDSVAWTPGDVQAERYDLSKHIEEIRYSSENYLTAFDKSGNLVLEQYASGKQLPDIIGKEAAEKLLAQEPNDFFGRRLNNADLKVGGEGMKGFYDRILPAEAGKYLKKLDKDAKVGTTTVALETVTDEESGEDFPSNKRQEVWSIPITDKIRNSVMQGQPLYQFAGQNAATANLKQLAIAKEMVASGENPEEVRKITGWFQGADRLWRFEINDSKAEILKAKDFSDKMVLGDLLAHPDLYAAYPDLKNLRVIVEDKAYGDNGSFSPARNEITLSRALFTAFPNPKTIQQLLDNLVKWFAENPQGNKYNTPEYTVQHIQYYKDLLEELKTKGRWQAAALKVVLHEVQHYVQEKENFARGGSPEGVSTLIQSEIAKYRTLWDKLNAEWQDIGVRAMKAKGKKKQELKTLEQQKLDEMFAATPPRALEAAHRELKAKLGESPDPQKAFEAYRRLAGEAEARDVSDRMDMTEQDRIDTPPNIQADALVVWGDSTTILRSIDQDVRGAFAYRDGQAVITLFEGADVSTLIHEMVGHYFVHNLLRDTSAATAADRQILLDFAGITHDEWVAENAQYEAGVVTDRYRAVMEKLARSAEAYFYTGRAPSVATRSMFRKFKEWLTGVYKDLSDLGVNITPEVRGVFDRMLASQTEIAELEKIEAYHTKLPTEILETMTPENQAKYEQALASARLEAEEALQSKLLDYLTTNAKLARDAERRQADADYGMEVDQDPLYVLMAKLETDYKLPVRTLAKRYQDGALPIDQEYNWDYEAEQAGYTSGMHLAATILEAPTRDQAVKAKVDEHMEAWSDTYLDKGKLKDAAREAMYSDDGRELLALEAQILQEKLGKIAQAEQNRFEAKLAAEQARLDAQEILGKRPLREALKLQPFIAAERKAAEQVAKYLAKGDNAEALIWKRKQLLSHAMVQESLNLRREFDKHTKYLKRQYKSKQDGWMTDDQTDEGVVLRSLRHFHAAAEILSRFGYKRKDYLPGSREENLAAYVQRMGEENPDMLDIADWIYTTDRFGKVNDLTIDELRDVVGAIKNIRQMARAGANSDGFVAIHGDGFEGVGSAVAAAVEAAEQNAKDVQQDAMGEMQQPGPLKKYLAGLKKPSQMFLQLDGMKDFGLWDRLFYHFVHQAAGEKSRLVAMVTDAIEAAYTRRGISRTQRQLDAVTKIVIPEWGNVSVTKNTLMAVLLNMGSKSNKDRLFNSAKPPIGLPASVTLDEASAGAVLTKYLTESDFRLAQDLWDAINLLYEPYNQMVKRMTGREMVKVEAQPIAFTLPGGAVVQLRGGYYPLAQDPRASIVAEKRAEQAVNDGFVGVMPYTNTGASKARAKAAAYAVDLRLDIMTRHILDVAQDIAFRPVMHDINKLMRQEAITEILRRKLGDASYKQIKQWQGAIAKGRDGVAESASPIDGVANWLRQRAVTANLLLRPGTVFQNMANPTLYGNAVHEFGEKDAFGAYLTYGWIGTADFSAYVPHALAGSAEAERIRQFVYAHSAMMRDKMENPDFSLRELHGSLQYDNKLTDFAATRNFGVKLTLSHEKVVEFAGRVLSFADQMTDIPMWIGAYQKALSLGKTREEATRLADTVIERSSGSGRVVDTAGLQRGSGTERLLAMFMTFLNTQYNRWAQEYNVFLTERDYMRMISFVATKYLLFGAISAAASFKAPDDDEDKWKWFAREVLAWPVGMFPMAGSMLKTVIDKGLGYPSYGFTLSPVERSLGDIIRLIDNVGNENKTLRENAELGMGVAAFLFRYPDQINDWLNNAYDIMTGGMEFKGTDIIRRRPKKER